MAGRWRAVRGARPPARHLVPILVLIYGGWRSQRSQSLLPLFINCGYYMEIWKYEIGQRSNLTLEWSRDLIFRQIGGNWSCPCGERFPVDLSLDLITRGPPWWTRRSDKYWKQKNGRVGAHQWQNANFDSTSLTALFRWLFQDTSSSFAYERWLTYHVRVKRL